MSSAGTPDGMVRNTSWLLLGDIVAKLAGFVFVVLVARIVGRAEYGYFTFAFSFVTLLLLVGRWGLSTAIQQEIAGGGDRVSQVTSSAFGFRAIIGALALAVVYATSPFFVDGSEAYWTIVIVGLALFLDEFTTLLFSVFNALEKMRYPAIILMLNRIGSTALTALALVFSDSIIVVSLTYLAGSLGALIGAALFARGYLPPLRLAHINKESLGWHLRWGSALGIASLLNAAVFRADAVMLQSLKGPVAVGLYGAAYRFFESFLFVAWTLGTVLFPRAIRAHKSGTSRKVYIQVCAVMLSFYLPLAAGTPFVSKWLVESLFSTRYSTAADAVIWLMTAGLFFSFAYLTRMAVIALERHKVVAWVAAATLVLNLGANAILIPMHSFTGAAVATFGAAVFEAVVMVLYFLRHSEPGGQPRLLLVPIVATGAMVAVLLALGLRDLGALIVAPIAYVAAWLGFATRFTPELMDEIKRILPGR